MTFKIGDHVHTRFGLRTVAGIVTGVNVREYFQVSVSIDGADEPICVLVRAEDLTAVPTHSMDDSKKAADELTELSQELGLY